MLNREEIEIVYLGVLLNGIILKLISLFEFHSNNDDELYKLSKKAALIITECFQNVSRHNNQNKERLNMDLKSFFQIQIQKEGVSISSKNLIQQEHISSLNKKIDQVNGMSGDELKKFWKKTILEGEFSDKGGAGLGIIEMARKSGLPIQKKFVVKNDKLSNFFMTINLPKRGHQNGVFSSLSKSEKACNQLIDEKIIIHYLGIFSQSTNADLIDILYFNFINENNANSKTIKNITVINKVLENAAKHGDKYLNQNKGMFSISENDEKQQINCSNFILNEKINCFEKKINEIKKLDHQELEVEYKNKLMGQELSENINLGLLEIAMYTDNKFSYHFINVNDTHSIFTIELMLPYK